MDRKVLSEVLEFLPTGVMLADETGAVTYANRAAHEYMGIDHDRLGEVNIREVVPHGSGRKELIRTRGDERITVRLTRIPLSDGCSAVVLSDVSEVHRLQQELLKMDRLASVGELTSGIAHEIRNPLAGIKTTAQALKAEIPENDHRTDYVTRIIMEIDRLNKLLLSFFDFAKPKELALRPCNLKKIVEDSVFTVQDEARKNHVQVMEFYPPEGLKIKADPGVVQQVLMNVFINALQAMPSGGRMEVHLVDDGAYARIEVRDTGKGIPEDIRSRIFDPFFTTKPKGIGLGLSISYRLIKMHSGTISFVSNPAGTTFTISLPKGAGT
ncbi:MAG TPA: ATP-binding protein [Deltaproteobacteria bacterium]|nr:ATP-binding protein [Deltaproteobacteria bacterium]HOI07205.1 ATP-binding protein [Deltaproteobacteria bacterium]